MFPTPKKVAFRAPLVEEIRNIEYTLRHSDILSPSSEDHKLELSPPKRARKDASDYQEEGAKLTADQADDDEDENESVPATPVAGRRKRDRQWRWTLGPLSPTSQEAEEESKE
jgi:hypothetical protein